ncbi:MAG TPA: S9 family peptidase [Planctomycetota bacterium]|nr:S9 family peptidase [Planctomycetota bacterium]
MQPRLDRLVRATSALFASAALLFAQEALAPPVARRVEHTQEWHGRSFADPYFWLREKSSPEVSAYLEAENAYTAAMTKDLQPLQDTLYREMVARTKQTDLSVPVRDGRYDYYSATVEGMQYPIRCRKRAAADGSFDEHGERVVLLDPNEMAKGLPYLGIGATEVSDDGNLLAYTTDTTGFRQYALHVKDLRTGAVLADTAERVTSLQWAADDRTLFFVTEDAVTKRSNQLWRLRLGAEPELVSEETDELYRIGISRTKDKRYLMLGSMSTDTSSWTCLDAKIPSAPFVAFLTREKGHRYSIEHRDGEFFLRTNKQAPNFRVVRGSVGDLQRGKWRDFVPHQADVLVTGFEVFAGFAVVQERCQALNRFRVFDFATGAWREITFPEPVYHASGGGTPEFTSHTYRVDYQSMVTPPCVYDYDLGSLERTLRKRQEVLGYDPAAYTTERLWATARDGTKVPLSIVHRKGVARDGSAPLWLYGYGSYGFAMPATFDSDRISLLDRGVVYAIAHIRGGNDLGEAWHEAGMLMNKKNTFTDFVDCAEYLVAEKWTSKQRLVIEGGSAGGLLMGAVVNLRPDLFRAVHSAVPFVDVMNTMMDASLPLTVGEYLEWGNPNEQAAFDYMMSYSPYDNLERKAYPATLVTTSFNDSQVMYWEPAKYVARLRSLKTDDHELLLRCKMEPAGHGGASGRYDRWKDRAFEYAWMLQQVGITK